VDAVAPDWGTPHRQATSWHAVAPNLAIVRGSMVGDRILLNLSPEVELTMFVTKVERHGDDSVSVFGRLVGFEDSSVILVALEDALASEITAPPAGLHYKTKYAGEGAGGVHYICRMDDDKYAPCPGGKLPPPVMPWEDLMPEAGEDQGVDLAAMGYTPRGTCANVGVVFDNMIIYTDVARVAAGGTAAIQAECQLAIDRTNESYENSPISARIRLIARYEVTYNEVGIYDDHLDRLTGTNGQGGAAPWTTIRTDRDQENADFCTLFVNDGDYCGLAWCTASSSSRAYEVVTWDCAAGNLSHPHEIGHNQGCDHDHDNETSGCAAYVYAYGHRFFGTNGTQYRTVMSYSPGTRIPYFSNPNVTFQGTATGVDGTGSSAARNEDAIENRKATCEAYEGTRWDIWVDFSYGSIEVGTYSLPYNTMSEGITNLDNWVSGASEYPNLYVKSGSSTYTGTISKVMTISPCGGSVTIGD
jgi:hypothetical protein